MRSTSSFSHILLSSIILVILTISIQPSKGSSFTSPPTLAIIESPDSSVYKSPNSSSSKKWRKKLEKNCGIDDLDTDLGYNKYFTSKCNNNISIEEEEVERLPLDRLKMENQNYLQYLATKKQPKPAASPISKMIARNLEKPNFMILTEQKVLKDWLNLQGTSMWDVARILESPNFDGLALDYLNTLPDIYIKKRLIVPFTAFMKRFEYLGEEDLVKFDAEYEEDQEVHFDDSVDISNCAPFSSLVLGFLSQTLIEDSTLDSFFSCLVSTQSTAFHKSESTFFNCWLRNGPESWKFIQIYFKFSASSTQSSILASILTSDSFKELLDPEFIEFLFKEIPEFNVNVRIPYIENLDEDIIRLTPLLHVLVLEPRLSEDFLGNLLKSPNLDFHVPTGKVSFKYSSCTISYVDKPIYFLAVASINLWALIHLLLNDRAIDDYNFGYLLLFVIYHIFNVAIRSLVSDLGKLFHKFTNFEGIKRLNLLLNTNHNHNH